MKRILIYLAVLLLAAVSRAAQSQGVELLRAEYGAYDHFVDVTAQVRSLIHEGILNIRVDNDTLGGDPAPGVAKSLRLRVRGDDGREQVLTFAEKQFVSLNIRRGEEERDRDRYRDRDRERPAPPPVPPQPVAGGALQILRADYGADGRFADVTSRLSYRIRGDALTLRVSNETMGGDPAEDRPKILRVWYSYSGRTASVVANENDVLNLPSQGDVFAGRLRIMRAEYGIGGRYADVTELLNSRIQGDQLALRVNNETMGGDPDPERPKQLVVFYVFDGRSYRVIVNEKSDLILPGNEGYTAGAPAYGGDQLQILNASYGAGDRRRDVTELIRAQVQGNTLQFFVSSESLGGDPAGGARKRLRVTYLWQGLRNTIAVGEGETLTIP